LGPDDGPPALVLNGDSEAPLVLLCDHASNAIPRSLNRLGLDDSALGKHVALDIGAGELTRRLAEALGVAAVLCQYSRLVIDCNRYLADPTAFQEVSDRIDIPGNRHLTQADRDARVEAIRVPYHAAISRVLAARTRGDQVPGLVSVHSFTPSMNEFRRPWHVGVLWDRDERFAEPMLAHLRRDPDLCVGDNEPYSGRYPADYTVDHHGELRGRPCVSLEIRQDLLLDEAGLNFWTARIASILREFLERPLLFRKRENGHGESADV
jgi:predicted N-formylglutamate amidohydrolase